MAPTVHPPPLAPPSPTTNPPRSALGEAEEGGTPRKGGWDGWRRLEPLSAPPSHSVPEGGLSSTSSAPSLRCRPPRPDSLCARVLGSTLPLAGTTRRVRAPTHVAPRTTTCPPYKMPRKGSSGSVYAAPTRPTRASRLLVTSCYPFSVTYSRRGLPRLDGMRMRRVVGSVAFSA